MEVVLKLVITDLISFLVFAILFGMFLDGVVGEVDIHVGPSFESELGRRGADVSLGKPVCL